MALDGTYSGLIASIREAIVDESITEAIAADLVVIAQARINRDLAKTPLRPMRTVTVGTLSGAGYPLPADLVGVSSFTLTAPSFIKLAFVTEDSLADVEATETPSEAPKYYALSSDKFCIWPAASVAYSARLSYWRRVPALSDLSPTNWLLTGHPDVYLYAAMLHAEAYVKDDARIALWASLYSDAVTALKAAYPEPTSDRPLRTEIPGLLTLDRTGWW